MLIVGMFSNIQAVHTGANAGKVTLDSAAVVYTGVTAVDLLSTAKNLTVLATDPNETVNVGDGPMAQGNATVQVTSTAAGFATLNIANATVLSLNTGGSDAKVAIDVANGGNGLASLAVSNAGKSGQIDITATPTGIPLSIADNSSDGDAILVGASQTVSHILGTIQIASANKNSTLTIDDSSDSRTTSATLTQGMISGLGSIEFPADGLASLVIELGSAKNSLIVGDTPSQGRVGVTTTVRTGSGANEIDVRGTSGALNILADKGDDTIIAGSQAPASQGTLAGVRGKVSVSGASHNVRLIVDDSGESNPASATISNADVTGLSPGAIHFATESLKTLTFRGGAGGNKFTVTSQSPGVATELYAGGGGDTVNVLVGPDHAYRNFFVDGQPSAEGAPVDVLEVTDTATGAVMHIHQVAAHGGTVQVGYLRGLASYIDYAGIGAVDDSVRADESFIQSLYHQYLHRDGSAAEVTTWMPNIALNGRTTMVAWFSQSPEANADLVQSWYAQYLGRSASAADVQFWGGMLLDGQRREDVIAHILSSDEYYLRSGGQAAGLVAALYHDLLGRSASQDELQSWRDAGGGTAARDDVAHGFLKSAEYRLGFVAQHYSDVLGRGIVTPDMSRNYASLTRIGPSADELRYWVYSKFALGNIHDFFADSDEFGNYGV